MGKDHEPPESPHPPLMDKDHEHWSWSSQIHHQFFRLLDVELQVIQLASVHKTVHSRLVFQVIPTLDTSSDFIQQNNWNLLKGF